MVQVLVDPIEDARRDETDDARSRKGPDEVRVLDDFGGGEGNGRGNGSGEQVERHDQTLHVLWGARVSEAKGGDVHETFRQSGYDCRYGIHPETDGRDQCVAGRVHAGGGLVAAGRFLVNEGLEDGVTDGSNSRKHEAKGDAGDGTEVNLAGAHKRVNDLVEDRNEDDD